MTLGMQSILLAPNQDVNSIQRKVARWEISHDGDFDILIVKWLDEVIYRAEVHEEFLLECQPMIRDGIIEAQVSYVSKDEVELEVEIKAVTPMNSLSEKSSHRKKSLQIGQKYHHSRVLDGTEMSSLTSEVARIPISKPIGPAIIQNNKTGIEIWIGRSAANIRIQIYLPANVSITRKCNHASIIISSVENNSNTISGVGICVANAIITSNKLGPSKTAYDAINGITQIRKSPTIFFVRSC
jgi:hypothetical protein